MPWMPVKIRGDAKDRPSTQHRKGIGFKRRQPLRNMLSVLRVGRNLLCMNFAGCILKRKRLSLTFVTFSNQITAITRNLAKSAGLLPRITKRQQRDKPNFPPPSAYIPEPILRTIAAVSLFFGRALRSFAMKFLTITQHQFCSSMGQGAAE